MSRLRTQGRVGHIAAAAAGALLPKPPHRVPKTASSVPDAIRLRRQLQQALWWQQQQQQQQQAVKVQQLVQGQQRRQQHQYQQQQQDQLQPQHNHAFNTLQHDQQEQPQQAQDQPVGLLCGPQALLQHEHNQHRQSGAVAPDTGAVAPDGVVSSSMSPGPLTAAFIKLLKLHVARYGTWSSSSSSRSSGSSRSSSSRSSSSRSSSSSRALPSLSEPAATTPPSAAAAAAAAVSSSDTSIDYTPSQGMQEALQDFQHWQQLLQHAQQLAPQLLPRQASLILYVCAKLRRQPQQQLLDALLQQLQPQQLQQLPAAGLINTIWALAVFNCRPDAAWMSAFYAAAAARTAAAAATGTDHADAGTHSSGAVSSSSSSRKGGAVPFDRHLLVQLLWSLGKLQQRPSGPWLHNLLTALQPQLRVLSPTELANTLWGLAQLGFRPSTAWLGAWFAASLRALPRTSPDSLVCMAACFGVLRLDLTSGRWLVAMRSAVQQQLGVMQQHHIASLLCGLAKRRCGQPPHWLRLLLQRQLQLFQGAGQHAAAAPRDVAATVWALPVLLNPTAVEWAAQPGNAALLKQLVVVSLPLLQRCTVGELVQLAVGFARLGYYPGAHWLKMHENAVAAHRLSLTDVNRWRLRAAVHHLWKDG